MQQQRKPSKHNQLATIRGFIAGEDVLSELLQSAIIVTWFETHNLFDAEDKIMINGKPCTMQEYEQAIAQASFKWVEERMYGQQTAPRVNDSEISELSGITENEAANEPVISVQSNEAKELMNRSKQYLSDKLAQFARQERVDIEIRNKALLWKRWNQSL